MHALAILTALLSVCFAAAQAVTGKLGDALITTQNPAGVSYQAVLQDKNTTGLRGYVTGTSSANGTGVEFNINLYGFPSVDEFGPFIYHLHAFPVPADGNCSGTLGHLDPFNRGETPPCNATEPQTCQVGDLSGKHGNITTSGTFQTTYLELYAATEEGLGSFFGNRSIVVHSNNKTRLNCANFTLVAGSQSSPTTSGPPAQFTGSAAIKTVSFAGMVVCLVGALLL